MPQFNLKKIMNRKNTINMCPSHLQQVFFHKYTSSTNFSTIDIFGKASFKQRAIPPKQMTIALLFLNFYY